MFVGVLGYVYIASDSFRSDILVKDEDVVLATQKLYRIRCVFTYEMM